MTGLLTLAFALGLVSVINPCGLALLPAWIAHQLDRGTEHTSWAARLRDGLVIGLLLAAGYVGLFFLAGVLIAAGAQVLLSTAPWLSLVIGGLLVLAGLAAILGRAFPIRLPDAWSAFAQRGMQGDRMVVFGAGYAVASISCSFGFFIALITQALSARSLIETLAVFLGYALGATVLLLAVTISTALAGGAFARLLRRGRPVLDYLTGPVMILAGVFLVVYWLPATQGGAAGQGLPDVATWTGTVGTWVFDHQSLVVLVAALVVGASAVAVLIRWLRRRRVADQEMADSSAQL